MRYMETAGRLGVCYEETMPRKRGNDDWYRGQMKRPSQPPLFPNVSNVKTLQLHRPNLDSLFPVGAPVKFFFSLIRSRLIVKRSGHPFKGPETTQTKVGQMLSMPPTPVVPLIDNILYIQIQPL